MVPIPETNPTLERVKKDKGEMAILEPSCAGAKERIVRHINFINPYVHTYQPPPQYVD